MAETHEGQQQQARPQPELAAAAASVADLLSTATPSTATPPPAVTGTAPASDDFSEEPTAQAPPKAPPLPAEQHRPHDHEHHQPSSLPLQAAVPEKGDTEELQKQGVHISPQTITRTTLQTAAITNSSAETCSAQEESTQPLPLQRPVGLTPSSVSGAGSEPGSEPETVSGSRLEPREKLTPSTVSAKAGIVPVAHEQERGEQQRLQPPHDPTPRRLEPSITNDTPSATTSATIPSILSSLATSSAATVAVASTGTDGTESTGQPNGYVSTSASPSPAPAAMSNLSSQFPGSPRLPQQQQQVPLTNYAPQSTYTTAATAGLNTQYGFAGTGTQPTDVYRVGTNVANSAMSLPSMRTLDRVQQTQQQQQPPPQHGHTAIAMPHAMASPIASNVGYYQQQPAPLTSNNAYGLVPDAIGGHRYPLPPNDPRGVLAGTRHKKEIKRRTKTGCLTCRKRRIKCDETHPVCKNCQKSKRECLGYDPIFKQTQNPTNIQPAPNHAIPAPASTSTSVSATTPTITGSALATSPVPGGTASYTGLPSVIPGASSTTLANNANVISLRQQAHSSASLKSGRGYSGAFDPVLPGSSTLIRKMKVGELVTMGGVVPPPLEAPLTPDKLQEVRDLYEQVYAVGLESFFESKWYMSSQGLAALASNVGINETVAGFLQSMAKTDANDVTGMQYSANLEFRVVWDLASLVNACEARVNDGNALPPPDDGVEARNRVAVFEALLSGDFLDRNPLMPVPSSQEGGHEQVQVHTQGDYHRVREFQFWYYLAEFLCVKDPDQGHGQPDASASTARREEILGFLRKLLDGRENRDVLYSFAVIRTLSPSFPADFESTLPPHLDESDPKSKLAVARKFIQDEAQVTGGTTNVVRRFSELAVRAFILPGGNAPKRMR